MRKMIVCLCAYLVTVFPFSAKHVAAAGENNTLNTETSLEACTNQLYQLIDFSHGQVLPYDVFAKAYRGYLNLHNAGKLNTQNNILTVCDFQMPSTENRMWIIDLDAHKVLFNTYVAHGQGSGDDGDLSFSNNESSHKSSLGFYVTRDTYEGEHGTSLHLDGVDQGFNDAAYEREIVVHGAAYVCDKFINQQGRLGRSWGCPAVSQKLSLPIVNTIKDGTCLFIYYPEQNYLKSSHWLNEPVADIPSGNMFDAMPQPKEVVYQYTTNGRVDSVRTASLEQ